MTSSSSWTVPSSPSGPCSARNATSGAASRSRGTRSPPTSIPIDVVPEPLERGLDPRAGAQRHLALEGPAALQHRDRAHDRRGAAVRGRRRAGSGSTSAIRASSAGAGRPGRRARAGERPVQPDLLLDDGADPAHALADACRRSSRRSSAASPSRRDRRRTRRGRGRTRRSHAARGPGGRSCRCSRAASPRRTCRPRAASTSPPVRSDSCERLEHHVAAAVVQRAERVDVLAPVRRARSRRR